MDFIGWSLTIFFSLLSLYLFLQKKYPGRITCYVDRKIPLLYSLVDKFKDVSIAYQNNPISNQLVIVQFFLVNTGRKDISSEMIRQPVTLKLPSHIKLLDVKATSSELSILPNIEILDNNLLKINFDSLVINENIKIEMLVEDLSFANTKKGSPLANLDSKAFEFSHRIIDTEKIKVQPIPDFNQKFSTKTQILRYSFILLLILGIIGTFFIPVSKNDSIKELGLEYKFEQLGKSSFYVEIKSLDTKNIKLVNDSLDFYQEVKIDSFWNQVKFNNMRLKTIPNKAASNSGVLKVFLLIILPLLLIMTTTEWYKENKYRNIFIKSIK